MLMEYSKCSLRAKYSIGVIWYYQVAKYLIGGKFAKII